LRKKPGFVTGDDFSRAAKATKTCRALAACGESRVLKGHDFSRAVSAVKSTRALAPEERFFSDSYFRHRLLASAAVYFQLFASPQRLKPESLNGPFAVRLERNHSCYIPKPKHSSRRDQQGAATFVDFIRLHLLWFRSKVVPDAYLQSEGNLASSSVLKNRSPVPIYKIRLFESLGDSHE
jgi:hypothetical protein